MSKDIEKQIPIFAFENKGDDSNVIIEETIKVDTSLTFSEDIKESFRVPY